MNQVTRGDSISSGGDVHKKIHGVRHKSVTQKNDTTAKFYCTKHGKNPTHPTDKCYTLKTVQIKPKELQIQA
jgi:hypothetical protein